MTRRISPFCLQLTRAVALVALLVASAVAQGVREAVYTVTDLGPLSRGESYAAGVNESGQVVGEFDTGSQSSFHGFLYSGGTMTDLRTLGGGTSAAYGINAAGQVVGESDTPGNVARHAFLYSDGRMTDLGTLGGTHSFALAINATGQVVGISDTPGNVARHAFLYSGGRMTDLGTLSGIGPWSAARGINATGQVVGVSTSTGNARHAFLYSDGAMTDLGTLDGTHSVAYSINATGQVVGQAQIPGDWAYHAFLYNGETMIDLGTLGGTHSVAYGINTAGQVVGQAQIPGDGAYHAFLYSGETMIDLNDLVPAGVTVTNATGINAAGQIVGAGRIGGSANVRALLLTPTFSNGFAYALADLHTTTSYTPDNAYNASGGAISITRQGVGVYDIAFDNRPDWRMNLSSAVAVTAYGSSPITCSVMDYSFSPSRTIVQVACFDVAPDQQRMADSPFTIMVVGNRSLPLQSAFVMSGGPVPVLDPASSWTSASLPITVTREALGEYKVLLGTGNTPMSAKLVTAKLLPGTTGSGTRCNHAQTPPGGLRVRCYDQTGIATDQGFSVVQVAGGRPGRRLGFAWAHRPGGGPSSDYTPHTCCAFNSAGGAIKATHASVGQYTMHFAGLQKTFPERTEHV